MFGFSRSLKMKTLNFIKRKCRRTGRAQPGPDETLGGKVWALTSSVTNVWPFVELESGGLQGCLMSARPTVHTGSWQAPFSAILTLCPHPNPLLAATSSGSYLQGPGLHRADSACGSQKLSQFRGRLKEKEFQVQNYV